MSDEAYEPSDYVKREEVEGLMAVVSGTITELYGSKAISEKAVYTLRMAVHFFFTQLEKL